MHACVAGAIGVGVVSGLFIVFLLGMLRSFNGMSVLLASLGCIGLVQVVLLFNAAKFYQSSKLVMNESCNACGHRLIENPGNDSL